MDLNLLRVSLGLDDRLLLLCLRTELVLLGYLLCLNRICERIGEVNVFDRGTYQLYIVLRE